MMKHAVFALLGVLLVYHVQAAFANVDNENWGSTFCPKGYVCVTIEEYDLHWDVCPITIPTEVSSTPTPTDEPTPTNTPPVESTSTPGVEPTNTPTDPTHKPKEKCNKGGGNGSDGCDPGNNPDLGHDDEDQKHPHKGEDQTHKKDKKN